MATIANLKVNVGADADQLISEFKRVEKSVKSIEEKMADAAKFGAKAFVALQVAIKATGVAREVVMISAEFESLKASLETVFGSQEAAALQFKKINDFASSTPFTIQQITEATIRMKSLGLDPSINSLRSMGNTASALGKPLMQFTEAVADAVVGEFERLKEFGIKAKSEGDKVKFTFQGVTTEIGKNADEINDYLLSIGENQFAGAIARQANTLNGVFSTLEGAVDSLAVKIGEESGLTGAVKRAGIAMTNFINGIIAEKSLPEIIDEISQKQERLTDLTDRLGGSHIYASNTIKTLKEELKELSERRDKMISSEKGEALSFVFGDIDKQFEDAQKVIELKRAADAEMAAIEAERREKEAMKLQEDFERVRMRYESEETILKDRLINDLAITEEFYENKIGLTEEKERVLANIRARYAKDMLNLNKDEDKDEVKSDKDKFAKKIANASRGADSVFDITKNLALDQGAIFQKEAVLGAYKVGAGIGGPPVGAAFAIAAGAATGALLSAISSAGRGGGSSGSSVPSGAVPTDGQEAITDAANDEPQNKTVFINVEGIDDEAFLTKNQVRSIVDQINEERDANVRIVL